MVRKYILLCFLLLSAGTVFSQGYHIGVTIGGLKNDSLLLGYHYGDKQFILDTIVLDQKGSGIFEGKRRLAGGIYLLVLPGMKYFEILVTDNQRFSLSTDTTDLFKHLRFKDSEENNRFIEYQKQMMKFQEQSAALQKKLALHSSVPDSSLYYRNRLVDLDRQMKEFWAGMIAAAPVSFMSDIVRAMRPIDMPDFQVPETVANKDSMKMVLSYAYTRDHFFDEYPFSDTCLLRTPIFHNKLSFYFTRFMIQEPDSIIPPMDRLLAQTKVQPSAFQYALIFLMNHYVNSNIMGIDAVYVHLAEKYYLAGQAPWVDSIYLKSLEENVARTEPNLIGKTAQNLILESITGEWNSLQQVKAKYTVLYFWEPNCGHCQQATPILYDSYKKWKASGLQVYAVYTQHDRAEWEKYINEKGLDWINVYDPDNHSYFRFFYNIVSTPTIYLLDSNKKIVAKRISVETLADMLDRLFMGKKI
jgi:thiol-disulfide isomerase/thioredoxin